MNEKPILFSTAMVQAILAGRKTMTRRVIKNQPVKHNDVIKMPIPISDYTKEINKWKKKGYKRLGTEGPAAGYLLPESKYQPGDLIYVRENWQMIGWSFEDGSALVRYENGDTLDCDCPDPTEDSGWLLKQVENLEKGGYYTIDPENNEFFKATGKKQPFKPSIHLPKSFSRIWLECTAVRAERLQDISEEDAIAEGVESWIEERLKSRPTHYKIYCDVDNPNDPATYSSTAYHSFESLWHLINGKESWDANPWVWVYSFKVLSTTGKPEPAFTPSLIATPGEGAVIVEGPHQCPECSWQCTCSDIPCSCCQSNDHPLPESNLPSRGIDGNDDGKQWEDYLKTN